MRAWGARTGIETRGGFRIPCARQTPCGCRPFGLGVSVLCHFQPGSAAPAAARGEQRGEHGSADWGTVTSVVGWFNPRRANGFRRSGTVSGSVGQSVAVR